MPSRNDTPQLDAATFLARPGEMAALMRSHSWTPSPLGSPAIWPQPLKTLIGVMLAADQPMFVTWGPERTLLYNEAYAEILASKHPSALGHDFLDVWSEIRSDLLPIVEQAYRGESVRMDDIQLLMHRRGHPEETHFAFSYTPIRDEGGTVAGFLCVCTETTMQVFADRLRIAERERLNQMFELAPGFRAMLEGPQHRIVSANPAYIRAVGHREVVGRTVAEALPDAVEQGYLDLLDRVYARNEAFTSSGAKYVVQTVPNGPLDERYIDFIYQPLADSDGNVSGIFVDGTDVTDRVLNERRQAFRLALEKRLQETGDPDAVMATAVALLGDHLGANRVGYGQVLPDGQTVRLSHCHAIGVEPLLGDFRLDGFGAETIVKQRRGETEICSDVLADPNQAPAVWTTIDTRAFVSVPLVRGGRFCASLYVNARDPRVWSGGDIALIKEVAARTWDAVERARAEARQRELNETLERRVREALAERRLLAEVLETTDAFIQIVDSNYDFLAINRANADEYQRVFGSRPRVGDNLLDILSPHPEQRDLARTHFARALAGETFTVTDEFGDPARGQCWYEITFSPLHGPGGELIGAYHFSLDITPRRREQERLREAEETLRQTQKTEALGQLTGGVAHDFNNLLTPIIGSLDMLVRRGVGSERERRLIDGALQSAERAKTLVQRLLAFARRQPLQPTAVDVGQLIEGMTGLIASTLGPTIEIRITLSPDLPPARADVNQLEMALLNLAVNARDAMPDGGELTIAAKRETVRSDHRSGQKQGHYVRLCVSDTGTGMDAATLARAVEPFFSTKGVGQGTGLGLSMVHGLAAQLGGGLTINSTPGQGTTIELWIPISAIGLDGDGKAAEASVAAKAHGTALLVDDEELVRMSTADMLIDLGYEVVEAQSAEEALQMIRQGLDVDLLLTDHLMPGMSGAELARVVRMERPKLPVLIVSGYAEAEGIDPDITRLTKPFRNAELAASLLTLMLKG